MREVETIFNDAAVIQLFSTLICILQFCTLTLDLHCLWESPENESKHELCEHHKTRQLKSSRASTEAISDFNLQLFFLLWSAPMKVTETCFVLKIIVIGKIIGLHFLEGQWLELLKLPLETA